MMNGIFGFHFEGVYCEARFINDELIDVYADEYNSDSELERWFVLTNFHNLVFKKVGE